MKKILVFFGVFFLTLTFGFVSLGTVDAAEEVVIGNILPLSGSAAPIGMVGRQIRELAIEEINGSGGIKSLGGAKIKMIYADSRGDPKIAISEAERLINVNKVNLITGAYQSAVSFPSTEVAERYKVGKEITGTITNVTDFGIFVELEEGIEGLVHVSEISKEKIKTPVGMFNISDVITARVMNINSEERRIGLSIKRMEIEDEQSLLSEYVNNMGPATSSFGEILRENLQEKLNED